MRLTDVFEFLFFFDTTISRIQWWLLQVIGFGIFYLSSQLVESGEAHQSTYIETVTFMLGTVLSIWVTLSANTKRFRAFDQSGWRNLWLLLPVIGPFYILYACGIKSENS